MENKKLEKRIVKMYKEFIADFGHKPLFAQALVKFDEDLYADFIKLIELENSEDDPDDVDVLYYVDGLTGLLDINRKRHADFVIKDIIGFSDYV